jgi:hypothetical protein
MQKVPSSNSKNEAMNSAVSNVDGLTSLTTEAVEKQIIERYDSFDYDKYNNLMVLIFRYSWMLMFYMRMFLPAFMAPNEVLPDLVVTPINPVLLFLLICVILPVLYHLVSRIEGVIDFVIDEQEHCTRNRARLILGKEINKIPNNKIDKSLIFQKIGKSLVAWCTSIYNVITFCFTYATNPSSRKSINFAKLHCQLMAFVVMTASTAGFYEIFFKIRPIIASVKHQFLFGGMLAAFKWILPFLLLYLASKTLMGYPKLQVYYLKVYEDAEVNESLLTELKAKGLNPNVQIPEPKISKYVVASFLYQVISKTILTYYCLEIFGYMLFGLPTILSVKSCIFSLNIYMKLLIALGSGSVYAIRKSKEARVADQLEQLVDNFEANDSKAYKESVDMKSSHAFVYNLMGFIKKILNRDFKGFKQWSFASYHNMSFNQKSLFAAVFTVGMLICIPKLIPIVLLSMMLLPQFKNPKLKDELMACQSDRLQERRSEEKIKLAENSGLSTHNGAQHPELFMEVPS